MTLNVKISIPEGQQYGAKITANNTVEIQPGECADVACWDTQDIVITEIPKKEKD